MMERRLVSVVMPAFNSEAFISEAVESVIGQTYPHWELIVVDDGSSDNTRIIVDGFMKRDGRIRYMYQKNSGPAAARNRGISESAGNYIAFIDSDDVWYPEKLEKQMKFLISHPGHVVYGGRNYLREVDGKFVESGQIRLFENHDSVQENFRYILFHPNLTITGVLLFEKDLLNIVGLFEETLRVCEDDYFIIRMAMHSKFYALNEPIDYRRKHDHSITGTVKNLEILPYRFRAISLALEHAPDNLLPDKKENLLSHFSAEYAMLFWKNGNYALSVKWLFGGFMLSPAYYANRMKRKFINAR